MADLSQLEAQSAAADQTFGLPVGTTYNLAGTESSFGTNLGSRGNIFQMGTAEQQQFGNGNDPNSAASYLSTLLNGPANGNLAAAVTMYQNGAGAFASGNTTPQYPSTSPIATFLQSQGYPLTGSDIGPIAIGGTATGTNGITAATVPAEAANTSEPTSTTGFPSFIDPTGSGYVTNLATGTTTTPAGDTISPTGTATGGAMAAGQSAGQATTSFLSKYLPNGLQIGGGLLALIFLTIGLIALVVTRAGPTVIRDAKEAI